MEPNETREPMSRRTILVAGAGTAVGVSLVAGCGNDTAGTKPPASGGQSGSGTLAKVADVPVGGAVSGTGPDGKPVIVSQPTQGDIVAFSAICTHRGCTVAPAGKILKCPCHGSTYDLATGDNTGGPAPAPLSKIAVKIKDGDVVEA